MNRRAQASSLWIPPLVSAAVALALRLVYLVSAGGNPFWRNLGLDMAGYDRWARAVLAGHGLGDAPFSQAPLFPLLLSAAYLLVGPDPVRALMCHLLPGVATVFLVALAAGRWRGPIAAWTAGLLMALYKPALFYTGVLLPPTWVTAWSGLAVFVSIKLIQSQGRPSPADRSRPSAIPFAALFGAGLVFGLLALGQPVLLLMLLPALFWIAPPRAPRAFRIRLPLLLGAAVPLLFSLLYNTCEGRTWSLITVNGGINAYIGNGPEANGAYVRPAGMREDKDLLGVGLAAARLGRAGAGGVSPGEADRYWISAALSFAVGHPLRTIGLYLRKLLFFFGQYEIPQVESLPFERRYSALLGLPLPGMAFLVAGSLLGLLLLWRDPVARWLAASVGVMAAGTAFFFVTARFRLPAAPFLVVLAGGGAANLWERRGRKRGESAAGERPARGRLGLLPASAAAAVTFLLLSINLTCIDTRAGEGQYHFRLGVIDEKEQHAEDAAREYRAALALDPSLGKAEVNLGTLLARQGRLDEARTRLEQGVSLDPLSAVGLVNLGQVYQLSGRPDDALAAFRRALEVDPGSVSARESAADLVYERGEIAEAQTLLEELARSAPAGSPPARRAAALLGILAERRSSGIAWGNGSAALRKADLRLAQGDAEEALRLYKVAADGGAGGGAGAVAGPAAAARQMLQKLQKPQKAQKLSSFRPGAGG
jgi:tetratricopeptide (TPR) repeat protein